MVAPPRRRRGRASVTTAAATLLAAAAVLAPLLLTVPAPAGAHSTMNRPQVTNNNECRLGGKGPHTGTCRGPCGPEYAAVTHTSSEAPATTWARGSRQSYSYLRNGHRRSGFVRITLVPVGDKMRHDAHTRFAFHYGCWGAGALINCTGSAAAKGDIASAEYCGTDTAMFRHPFTVPTVYPDGDYIFGWVWYGGGGDDPDNHGSLISFFADYWQCSYVRIKGGMALTPNATAQFVTGPGEPTDDPRCLSSVSRPGVAGPEPVNGRPLTLRKPDVFTGDRPPPVIKSEWMEGGIKAGQEEKSGQEKDKGNGKGKDDKDGKKGGEGGGDKDAKGGKTQAGQGKDGDKKAQGQGEGKQNNKDQGKQGQDKQGQDKQGQDKQGQDKQGQDKQGQGKKGQGKQGQGKQGQADQAQADAGQKNN
ncbi:hypothetical protein BU14_2252s0001, partial [Porphyra umbilicalis]